MCGNEEEDYLVCKHVEAVFIFSRPNFLLWVHTSQNKIKPHLIVYVSLAADQINLSVRERNVRATFPVSSSFFVHTAVTLLNKKIRVLKYLRT